MKLINKTILITGASSGIGKALAEQLSINNRLILIARRENLLLSFKAKRQNPKYDISIYSCDVSVHSQVSDTFKSIKTKYDKIDLAILNAGVSFRTVELSRYNNKQQTSNSKNSEYAESDFEIDKAEQTFRVNVFGLIYSVSELIKLGLITERGIIAGVSSMADGRGFPKSGFYCASKAAATIYLESLRNELFPTGIKVLTIKPGFVKTPMTDKNEFKMPLIIGADKAAKIIISGIEKEKRIIRFPFVLSLLTRILRLLPNSVFDLFSRIHLKSVSK